MPLNIRRLVAANRNRWATVCMLVLAQELAYALLSRGEYDYPVSQIKILGASVFRLLLEAQLAYAITLLPVVLRIMAVTALHLVLMVAVVVHQESGLLLTISLIKSNAAEGTAALGAGVSISSFSAAIIAAMLASLAVSLRLPGYARSAKAGPVVLLVPAMLLGTVDGVYMAAIDPPGRIRSFVSPKRLMLSYGYVGYVAADAHYMAFADVQKQYEAHLARQKLDTKADDIELLERPTSIYMVQWESLDERALFLAEKNSSLTSLWAAIGGEYMLTEHHNGSADTDYTVNTGLPAPVGTNPYLLERTGREFYLPEKLKARGYDPVFVHCNTPTFFSRGRRIAEFGYEKILWSDSFAESLKDGIFSGINDALCVQQLLTTTALAPGQFLYFVTLTSHYPYRNLPESRALKSGTTARYAAEIAYSAEAIASFADRVPTGALLVIFGDHPALGLGGPAGLHRVPLMCGIRSADGSYRKCRISGNGEVAAWSLPYRLVAMLGPPAE